MNCIMEKNCNLLYKQKLGLWIKNQRECGKFRTKDIDLVVKAIRFSILGTSFDPFLTHQRIGYSLQFDHLDILRLGILRMKHRLNMFNFTDTKLKLDNCQQTLCTEVSKKKEPKLVKLVQDMKKKLKKEPMLDVRKKKNIEEPELDTLFGLVRGSLNGNFFLVYSKYGHLVLMNLETSTGSLIGRWPVDPEDRSIPNHLNGAVSRDGSLVAVFGPTTDPFTGVQDYNMLRFYDIKSRQCHTIKLPLDPVISFFYHHPYYRPCDSVLSFNPFNQNLLYFMAKKVGPVWSKEADNIHLVLYDFKEEMILATRREFLLTSYMGSTLGYEDVEGPVFLHYGEIIIAYHMDTRAEWQCDYIGLLDAFSLDTIATVNLPKRPHEMCRLKYHFLVSTCETEIVIFKRDISTGDVEAQVYEIPDYDLSLMNLCRNTIRKATRYKDYKIDELTMLPPKMRDYLKI